MTIQDDVRSALVKVIQGVPNVGNVYDRPRYNADWTRFLDQFVWTSPAGKKQVRGWWLSSPGISTGSFYAFNEYSDLYDWPIRGVMLYRDADDTEAEFENLYALVRDTLRRTANLSVSPTEVVPGGMTFNVTIAEPRMFGSTLVHYCEIHALLEIEA